LYLLVLREHLLLDLCVHFRSDLLDSLSGDKGQLLLTKSNSLLGFLNNGVSKIEQKGRGSRERERERGRERERERERKREREEEERSREEKRERNRKREGEPGNEKMKKDSNGGKERERAPISLTCFTVSFSISSTICKICLQREFCAARSSFDTVFRRCFRVSMASRLFPSC
jgi:hypothetical protein